MSQVRSVCQELAQARQRRGWSLKLVADRLGVAQSTVCAWETGARTPLASSLEAWAALFGYALALQPTPLRRAA